MIKLSKHFNVSYDASKVQEVVHSYNKELVQEITRFYIQICDEVNEAYWSHWKREMSAFDENAIGPLARIILIEYAKMRNKEFFGQPIMSWMYQVSAKDIVIDWAFRQPDFDFWIKQANDEYSLYDVYDGLSLLPHCNCETCWEEYRCYPTFEKQYDHTPKNRDWGPTLFD